MLLGYKTGFVRPGHIFYLKFHVSLDGHSRKAGVEGVVRYSNCALCKHQGDVFCFVKALGFFAKFINCA